jgi:hypothetical protein
VSQSELYRCACVSGADGRCEACSRVEDFVSFFDPDRYASHRVPLPDDFVNSVGVSPGAQLSHRFEFDRGSRPKFEGEHEFDREYP